MEWVEKELPVSGRMNITRGEQSTTTSPELSPNEIEFRVGWIRECLRTQPDTMCYEFLEDLRRLALGSTSEGKEEE